MSFLCPFPWVPQSSPAEEVQRAVILPFLLLGCSPAGGEVLEFLAAYAVLSARTGWHPACPSQATLGAQELSITSPEESQPRVSTSIWSRLAFQFQAITKYPSGTEWAFETQRNESGWLFWGRVEVDGGGVWQSFSAGFHSRNAPKPWGPYEWERTGEMLKCTVWVPGWEWQHCWEGDLSHLLCALLPLACTAVALKEKWYWSALSFL